MTDVFGQPSPTVALVWTVLFAINGSLVGAVMVPAVIATRRKRISYMTAYRIMTFIALIGWIPSRVIETLVIYHHTFREGWWVVLWIIAYTISITTILDRIASKFADPLF